MWSTSEGRNRASWRRTWHAGKGPPVVVDAGAGAGAAAAAAANSLPLSAGTDAPPHASWSHKQSPHHHYSTRHTLDRTPLREYASACISKLSRSKHHRMSSTDTTHDDHDHDHDHDNNNNYYLAQNQELVSPISGSAPFSPRFPGPTAANQHTPPSGDHSADILSVDAESIMEGVQVIRADIEPVIHTLYESSTERYQYVVADPTTNDAIIIDPVLDRNPYAPGINTTAADQILYLVRQYKYHVVRILETHSNQEHPTSAWYLRTQLRDSNGQMPRICTGKALAGVQRMFARQYGVRDAGWAARFDSFRDGQVFVVGEMKVQCIHLLSQPDWFGYIIGHNVFLGKEVPKDLTESAAVRPTQQVPLRKLARYVHDYAFHPQKSDRAGELSRPSTAQTEVSQWMHEPVTPRASGSNVRRIIGRQQDSGQRTSTSSRASSSSQSNRRISQIPELA